MISIQNVNKRFGRLQALRDVNLECGSGQCIALIGPNGCGKTTLIKSVLGMVLPDAGLIQVGGRNVAGDFRYREQIGYMPQIGRYPENMSIGQVISMVQSIRRSSHEDTDLMHAFRLGAMSDKKMRTLSGGTTQKVSAALAFLFSPEILILDEPTAGLDPLAAQILKEKIIAEKNKGRLVIITSHLLSELDELVSQVVFMQEGNIVFHKNISELIAETGESRLSKAIATVMMRRADA